MRTGYPGYANCGITINFAGVVWTEIKNKIHLQSRSENDRSGNTKRSGRVVECGGLENRCTARYRGFESLLLCIVIP